jgi:hypothetical protein
MQITIKGKITDIFPPEIYGNLEKRVAWVVEIDVQYPQHYSLEFLQNDCNILDNFVPNDMVECKVDVRGRRWEKGGKVGVMNSLKCWRMDRIGQAKPAPSTRQQTGGIPPKNQAPPPAAQGGGYEPIPGGDDDLPF